MTATIPRHPAQYHPKVAAELVRQVGIEADRLHCLLDVLDPCAGLGARLGDPLVEAGHRFVGVDVQPEWAAARPWVQQGDATALPGEWTDGFHVVASSPVYPNRMTDHHQAADVCKTCGGMDPADYVNDPPHTLCPACKGTRLSRRNTYAHALREAGTEPAEGSAVTLGWGKPYRDLHTAMVMEVLRVVRPGGLVLWNVKNHVADFQEQMVAEWFLYVFISQRCFVRVVVPVPTPGNRQGANAAARVGNELVLVLRAPGGEVGA